MTLAPELGLRAAACVSGAEPSEGHCIIELHTSRPGQQYMPVLLLPSLTIVPRSACSPGSVISVSAQEGPGTGSTGLIPMS